jgi:tetratricopeptide (TPR) repeat protein
VPSVCFALKLQNYFQRLKKLDEALEILTAIIELNPSYIEAIISRGNVLVDYGHERGFERAKSDFERVLLRKPNDLDVRTNLAYLLQIKGKFMQSWSQFSLGITMNSGD